MEINLQGGLPIPQTLPSARSADTPVVQKTDSDTSAPMPQKVDLPDPQVLDQARYQQVVQASQHFFKDVYAVSDTTFTIFKDASGQYITRYTSLRDGKVTYIPEPQLLQYMQHRQQTRNALVEIQA